MQSDEPGVTLGSLLKMFKRTEKIRPVVKMSTCGHCKQKYDINKGHMCPYIREVFKKIGIVMSYRAKQFTRTGNSKMAANIKDAAKSCGLAVNSFSANGWVLKTITITVYGHEDDIKRFESMLPHGVGDLT
jgi:hypothetical protein